MIFQLLMVSMSFFFIGIAAFFIQMLSKSLGASGSRMLPDLCWLMEKTPALDMFWTILIRALWAGAAVVACIGRISNHMVLSLDILAITGLLMLSLYYGSKSSEEYSSKTV